jgi:hypothetical protein
LDHARLTLFVGGPHPAESLLLPLRVYISVYALEGRIPPSAASVLRPAVGSGGKVANLGYAYVEAKSA